MSEENGKELIVHDTETLPAKQSSDTMMKLIEKIALMPDSVATGNLERLHKMHKEMQDREAEVEFNKAFVAAQSEMPIVVKDAKNDQTSSKYAKLQTITKLIKPIYTKHGFGMIGGMAESPIENNIRVTINLIHSGGHSKDYYHDMPIDDKGIKGSTNKTQPHAVGSSTTYATRYLKCLIWDVQIVEDDDGNGAGKKIIYITSKHKDNIINMLASSNTDTIKFLGMLPGNIDSVDNIPLDLYDISIGMLKLKKKAVGNGSK